jgi:hypothetical protein
MDVLSFLIWLNSWLEASNQEFIYNAFSLLIVIAALRYRKNDNKLFIVGVVLIPTLIDILFLGEYLFSGAVPNYAVFLIYSLYDFCVLLLLLYRERIVKVFISLSLKLGKIIDSDSPVEQTFIYSRHVNEYKIIVIFALSIFINILVATEYFARWHIDDQLLYLYYLYTPSKLLLNVALVYFVVTLGSPKTNTTRS